MVFESWHPIYGRRHGLPGTHACLFGRLVGLARAVGKEGIGEFELQQERLPINNNQMWARWREVRPHADSRHVWCQGKEDHMRDQSQGGCRGKGDLGQTTSEDVQAIESILPSVCNPQSGPRVQSVHLNPLRKVWEEVWRRWGGGRSSLSIGGKGGSGLWLDLSVAVVGIEEAEWHKQKIKVREEMPKMRDGEVNCRAALNFMYPSRRPTRVLFCTLATTSRLGIQVRACQSSMGYFRQMTRLTINVIIQMNNRHLISMYLNFTTIQ